jgi:hypothetical protein
MTPILAQFYPDRAKKKSDRGAPPLQLGIRSSLQEFILLNRISG